MANAPGLEKPLPAPHSIFPSFVAWTPVCARSQRANTQGLPTAAARSLHPLLTTPPMQEDGQCVKLARKSSNLLTLEDKCLLLKAGGQGEKEGQSVRHREDRLSKEATDTLNHSALTLWDALRPPLAPLLHQEGHRHPVSLQLTKVTPRVTIFLGFVLKELS